MEEEEAMSSAGVAEPDDEPSSKSGDSVCISISTLTMGGGTWIGSVCAELVEVTISV